MEWISIVPIVLSIAFMIIVPLCASGAIKANPVVGIKWGTLQESEDAWQRGHKAAIPATFVGSILSILAGVVFFFIPNSGALGPILAFVFVLGGFAIASRVAINAAK